MILAIDKVDRHGLSNTSYHECLIKKTRVLTIKRDVLTSSKTEHFSCKGEYIGKYVAMHLHKGKLGFRFMIIILELSTNVNSFIKKVTEYKLKNLICMHYYAFLRDDSLFT